MRTLVLLLFATISFRGYSQPQPKLILPDYDQYEACIGLAFNPQKTLYYNLNSSGVLKFYESSTNKLLHSIGTDSLQVTQAIFVEEKRVLISASSNSRKINSQNTYRVYLFDLETNEIIYVFKEFNLKVDLNKLNNAFELYLLEPFGYSSLDFNKSKSLISIQYGKTIEIWNLKTFRRMRTFKNEEGIAEFNGDGEFIVIKDRYSEIRNVFAIASSWKDISKRKKKAQCLEDALSIEVILGRNIALIGTKNGELLVKDLKNWETIKVLNLYNSWLHFIGYDEKSGDILTYGFNKISDENFTSCVKILNVESFTLEEDFEVYPNQVSTDLSWLTNNITLDAEREILFFQYFSWPLYGSNPPNSRYYLEAFDFKSRNFLFSSESFSKFNENNLSKDAVLIPELNGVQLLTREQLQTKSNPYDFNEIFVSNNEKYFAHVTSRFEESVGIHIWDLKTGIVVVSDTVLNSKSGTEALGFDFSSNNFLFRQNFRSTGDKTDGTYFPRSITRKIIVFDIKSKIFGSNDADPEILPLQNKIENNLKSIMFFRNVQSTIKNVYNSWKGRTDSLNKDLGSVINARFAPNLKDAFLLEPQGDYLLFERDSTDSSTITLVKGSTGIEIWKCKYEGYIFYDFCGSDKFLLVEDREKSALHVIELATGQKLNVVEEKEESVREWREFNAFLNLDGEWLVVQKRRENRDDLFELEFWNISQKKKIFEFTSLTDISSLSIVIDTKRNRFISNHSGQFNYYSLSDGMKLGAIDLDVERDFSGYYNNENICWLTDDNKFLIVADGTSPNKVSVYDNATLKKLYTRIQSPDGNWIAFDKDLNYDGSEGALKEVYYVKGLQVLSDYVPKESKHVPGLIEKVMSR